MFRLILKNLWARRRRNGWLLAELLLVSILAWVILDPVIVVTHDRSIPLGYDADRLCLVSLAALQPGAPGYDSEKQDSATLMDNYMNLVRRARGFEGVERTTPLMGFCYPCSQGSSSSVMMAENDTLRCQMLWMQFLPHTQFFETYGFRPAAGRTPEQLSDYDYVQNDVVLSENTAQALFGRSDVSGRRCWRAYANDTTYFPVVGVLGTFKAYSEWKPVMVAFRPVLSVDVADIPESAQILVRLKEGVSMRRFLHDFRPWMVKELKAGNLFARQVRSYDAIIAEREAASAGPIYRRNLAMAAFFLINLCLGVIGTFWLQTRTRREEVGVMLSFGGTPGHIIRMLMGEGAVLTAAASLVGFFIYLQYALKEGLHKGLSWMRGTTDSYWVSDFTQHFIGVSLIIFVLLLAVVMTGIFFPARNISRISPTDALRDE